MAEFEADVAKDGEGHDLEDDEKHHDRLYEDSSQPGSLCRWDGPFLCQSCQEKKEAMEGKRRSRGLIWRPDIYI